MIRALLFDLDNTLYPQSSAMEDGFTRRIIGFVSAFLNVDEEEAVRLRRENLARFGTTFEWLKESCGLTDEDSFFNAVHPENEVEEVEKDPALRGFLISLELPLFLLTNAPRIHAERMLKYLDVFDLFSKVYDLNWNKGVGKPHASGFLNPLSDAGLSPAETLFIDDSPKYVLGYKAVGGPPVLVDEFGRHGDFARKEGIYTVTSIYGLPSLGIDGIKPGK